MAARFDASTDRLRATTALPTTNVATIVCWAKIVVDRNNFSGIFALGNSGTTGHTINATTDADGTTLYAHSGDATTSIGNLPLTAAAWHRIAVIANGANTTIMVGNATPTAALTQVGPSALTIGTSITTLSLGDNFYGEWFSGDIAAFKMWNAALTPAECLAELTQYDALRTANLVRAHRLDVDLSDTSGLGVGALTAGGTSVSYVAGPSIPFVASIAVDASSPADVNSGASNVTAQTTAAFNPPICVLVACTVTDGSDRTVTITNNSTALTWTLIGRAIGGASFGTAAAHVAVLTAGRTGMTVTSTLNSADNMALKVYCLTGVDTADPIGGSNLGTQLNAGTSFTTTAFITELADSLGFVVGDNFDTVGLPSSTDATEVAWYTAGQIAGLAGYKTLGAVGSSTTFNLTATAASADWAWVAFEIRTAPKVATAPIIDAGYSTYHINNVARQYYAPLEIDNGAAVSARSWTVLSGPNQVGNSLGTARTCTFTPTALGTYVLRYTATNSVGTSFSDVSIVVVASSGLPDHVSAMAEMSDQ